MARVRLDGPLRQAAVRGIVLGRPDRPGEDPLTPEATAAEVARLSFYAAALGAPGTEPYGAGAAPDGEALDASLARDIMALCGQADPAAVAARLHPMRVRAASRVAARDRAPVLRRAAAPGDVAVRAFRQPYARFFAIEEYDLAWRRFDGALSDTHTRAVFVSGDAVTVLPYDPLRDRVLLVEQFRAGPFGRGDPQPWQLEPIAGRVDPGETPEAAARREALEEAGLSLGALHHVAGYYPSPGAKTEYLDSFVGLAELPDGRAGVFGLEAEAEDIRGHLVAFDALVALVASGEVQNGPLLVTALWLQRERDRLRGG